MPRTPTEASIESSIVTYAKKRGVLVYKFTSPSQRSVPDRLFIYKGHVMFMEIKRLGEIPTKLQTHELAKLVDAGVSAVFCDNAEDGKAYVDNLIDTGNPVRPICGCGDSSVLP